MVLLDMLSILCSRLQSKPDYSTVPQLGQVTVLLVTVTVWSRFCGAASDWVSVTLIPSQ